MAKPKPDDSDHEGEVDPTRARLDLLAAYTMRGRLERRGLLSSSDRARAEEAVAVVTPPAPEDDGYFYKAPGENAWRAA